MTEKILVTGATGAIGRFVVQELIAKGIPTTIYVRNEQKAKEMFSNELTSSELEVFVGDNTDYEAFAKAIQGHTRLFLLTIRVWDQEKKLAEIAFEKGVKQIVKISVLNASISDRSNSVGYRHADVEETIFRLAEQDIGRSAVMLRPSFFHSNFLQNAPIIKSQNRFFSPKAFGKLSVIDPHDIADAAVNILQDPLEKHAGFVYNLGNELLTSTEVAESFSKVLGRAIEYVYVDPVDTYNAMLASGADPKRAYFFVTVIIPQDANLSSAGLRILLKKEPRSLESWVRENKHAFL